MTDIVLATNVRVAGGVWRHVCDLADGLHTSGRTVRIALPADALGLRESAERLGLQLADPSEVATAGIFHLHLADTYDRDALAQLVQARRSGAKVVVTEHLPRTNASDVRLADRPPRFGAQQTKSALKAAQYAASHRVIAVSDGCRRFLLERYLVPARKIVTVVNGVAPSPGTTPMRAGGPTVVAAGSVITQKGFDVLLTAAILAQRDWTALVLGDGPHLSSLRARAAVITTSTGGQRVTFAGWSNDVATQMASARAVVMPSRWESSGYAALEAMSMGRAVIGTQVDGLEDIIVPGVTGFLVPPGEPLALARAIDAVSLDAERCARMGAAGRDRVIGHFSLDAMVAATGAVYDSLFSAAAPTAAVLA